MWGDFLGGEGCKVDGLKIFLHLSIIVNVMTTLRRMDSVIDVIQRIAELQLSYNSSNTEEMQERGRLIRKILPQELSFYMDSFRKSLGRFSHDLSIQGKDGQGLKTEAPWVRLHSQSLSPIA